MGYVVKCYNSSVMTPLISCHCDCVKVEFKMTEEVHVNNDMVFKNTLRNEVVFSVLKGFLVIKKNPNKTKQPIKTYM